MVVDVSLVRSEKFLRGRNLKSSSPKILHMLTITHLQLDRVKGATLQLTVSFMQTYLVMCFLYYL